jgi:hypothetical protein
MQFNFDATNIKPADAFEPIPEGWVHAAIESHEAKQTKNNPQNAYVKLDLVVIDGEHKGRKFRDMLNLWNDNQQAVEIAQRQLSAYCHATGVIVIQDISQLHGIPMYIKLGIKQDVGYEPSNVVRAVKHIQDNVGQVTAPQWPVPPGPMPVTQAMPPVQPQPASAVPMGPGGMFSPPPAQQQPQSAPIPPWGMNPQLPPQPAQLPVQQPAPMPAASAAPSWAQQQPVQQQAPVQQAPSGFTPPAAPAQPQRQRMPWEK